MQSWNWLNPYWPEQQWSDLSDFDRKLSMFLLILAIIIIIILIVLEYKEQDCIPGKLCYNRVEPPNPLNSSPNPLSPFSNPLSSHNRDCHDHNSREQIKAYIDKIEEMVTNNYRYHIWRLSLLSGLIATVPVVYFLKGRIPVLIEWIVIGTLIFLATYLAFSWIWAHFFYPNSQQMEQHLQHLRKSL